MNRTTIIDATVIALVAVGILAVYAVTAHIPAKQLLAFGVFNIWLKTVVHLSWRHALANIVTYAFVVSVLYWMCTRWTSRVTFWGMFGTIFVTVPVLVHVGNTIVYQWYIGEQITTVGFSGIVAALVGSLAGTAGFYANARLKHGSGWIVIYAALLLDAIAFTISYSTSFVGLVTLLVISILWFAWATHWIRTNTTFKLTHPISRLTTDRDTILVVLAVVLQLEMFFALFPSDIVHNGVVTNIIGHGAGFIGGLLVTIVYVGVVSRYQAVRSYVTNV